MKEPKSMSYILGLDLGANSIGWAILEANQEDGRLKPFRIERAGVRIFEEGVENINTSKEAPRAQHRREMRLMRRQADFRARRHSHLFFILQNAGLLPPSEIAKPEIFKKDTEAERRERNEEKRERREKKSNERDRILRELDKKLIPHWRAKLKSEGASQEELSLLHMRFPYVLRARALKEKLEPYELGRALYHLGQRRGFKSNRKSQPKKNEKPGEVEKGINDLKAKMKEKGAETLGQYFSMCNPEKEQEKIRGPWTHRDMYKEEFGKIWAAQQPHYPDILTDALKERIQSEDLKLQGAIFYQRPLKDQSNLIGFCELEEGERRASRGLLLYQRFRLIKTVNNIRIIQADKSERELSQEEKDKLIKALEKGEGVKATKKLAEGDLSISQAKDILDIGNRAKFNFGEDEEEAFIGNRTAARIRKALGQVGHEWKSFSPENQDAMVDLLMSSRSDDEIAKEAQKNWGLSQEQANNFSKVSLEAGYSRLSKKAIEKMMPFLKKGLDEANAKKEAYPDKATDRVEEFLPPVQAEMPELTNPVVRRALNELRKVMNAIIREYGKPAQIRIEMARDLKKSSIQRGEVWRDNLLQRKKREEIKSAIQNLAECGIADPKGDDITKWLLAEECNWRCPYTEDEEKARINPCKLFRDAEFEVEHIIPLSRCLDDSFVNKTLCRREENRKKHNRTPYEAYQSDPEKYNTILQWVERFKGGDKFKHRKGTDKFFKVADRNIADEKLRRFKMNDQELEEFLKGFTSRHLNDTRYFTTAARKYLSLLYGKVALTRIRFTGGQVTAYIRDVYGLNSILNDGGRKSRKDHCHHAVDALAVALTDDWTVQQLSRWAEIAPIGRRFPRNIQDRPWPGFNDQTKSIRQINASHRVSRKVNGPLHAENECSPPKPGSDGKQYIRVRKALKNLSTKDNDIEDICGENIKRIVKERLAEEGGDPKVFENEANLPFLQSKKEKDGRKIPIKKVHLLKKAESFLLVKDGVQKRYSLSAPDINHHFEIIASKNEKGEEIAWEVAGDRPITRLEAMRRARRNEPIIQQDHGEDNKTKFSLAPGEIIELDDANGGRVLYRIRSISGRNVEMVQINDGRPKTGEEGLKKGGGWKKRSVNELMKLHCQKVIIDPLGNVRRAND